MSVSDRLPEGVTPVREVPIDRPPALVHAGWRRSFPWLVQGTTRRGGSDRSFDLGLFSGGSPTDAVRSNWAELAESTGFSEAVHAKQVHGCDLHVMSGESADEGAAVPRLLDPADGHLTDRPGTLLAVTTADCVPTFVVHPHRRVVGAIHAGWRGAAAGILERGLDALESAFDTAADELHVHFGPAICGVCYEVGPEVFEALGLEPPTGPTPIDLRRALAGRAVERGVQPSRITVSTHCTRCGDSGLYSHRAGDAQRQVGFIGIRP
jgi:YfiH family protein